MMAQAVSQTRIACVAEIVEVAIARREWAAAARWLEKLDRLARDKKRVRRRPGKASCDMGHLMSAVARALEAKLENDRKQALKESWGNVN